MNFKDLKRSYIESDPTSDAALNTKLLDSIGFECIEKRSPKTDKSTYSVTVSYKEKELNYVVISLKKPTIESFLREIIEAANRVILNDYLAWCKVNSIVPDEAAEELYNKHHQKAVLVLDMFGEDMDSILEEIEDDGFSQL